MNLDNLLESLNYRLICGDTGRKISTLEYNSKLAIDDSVFVAIKGHKHDGKGYIGEAIANGARTIILQDYEAGKIAFDKELTVIEVDDARKALAEMSCKFYNNPSEDMQVIGVTGTKGKTSVTFMIKHILEMAGIKTGIIGTVKSGYQGNYAKVNNTTPESLELQKLMREMVQGGCKAVVMEVSSQGLMDKRVECIDFNIGVFTNISPDHIGEGEHGSFEEYMECKSHLFDLCQKAIINKNDAHWREILNNRTFKKLIFFGGSDSCDFSIENIKDKDKFHKGVRSVGSSFDVVSKTKEGNHVHTIDINLPGNFNVENAVAAISVARTLGIPWDIIKESLETVVIPGRSEIVNCKSNFTVMVDYAHNGIALTNLLETLKNCHPNKLIVVFGSGGNRDRNRRFEMGKAAYRLADYIIVTSDNPRNEDPMKIIRDITSVMEFCYKPILVIPDRKKAIERAMEAGEEGDIIVIAGKGHETYQIIGDETIYFDDREVVLSYRKEQ